MPLPAFIPALLAALKVGGAAAGAGALGTGVATAAPVAAGMATAPAIASGLGAAAPMVAGGGMASGFGGLMGALTPMQKMQMGMQFMGSGQQQQSQNKQPAMKQMGYMPNPTPQAPPDLASLLAAYQQRRGY